jgi:AbiJ N-terminal domain 3
VASLPGTAPARTHGQSCDITPVTRRDVFDLLRAEKSPWWGRLDETEFLGQLYDLDALPSTDPRHATAGEDILRHRVANFDWDDDWVFSDQRFRLADGPDQVLLDFLALMAHPLVQPDTEQAARLVASLNVLLAPDGWELRTARFISGRPVYSASRATSGAGRMIRLEIGDDDAGKLDIVLGQAHYLLGENGDAMAQGLIAGATLALRRDGGYFHPMPGDNWTSATYEAVLTVAPEAAPEFTPDVESRVWSALSVVLAHHGRDDVLTLVIARAIAPLPAVSADWRLRAAVAAQRPTNQARRERAGDGYPSQDGLTFGSQAELAVYNVLMELQRDFPVRNAFAVLPLPGARLRDTGVRTPDFVVIGNGRAVVIEVDGPHHSGRNRRADDADRDLHWRRCGVVTIRIASEHTSDHRGLKARLEEELKRDLRAS